MLLRSIVLVPLAAMLFLGACGAPKRPISPFMQEQSVFSQNEEKAAKDDKSDGVIEALATISVFMKTDVYATPHHILLGEDLFAQSLAVLEKADENAYGRDGVRFAKGVALFHLHRYEEAVEMLKTVSTESVFGKDASEYFAAATAFNGVPRVWVGSVATLGDLQKVFADLATERQRWFQLAHNASFIGKGSILSCALEEVERVDEVIFGLVAEYQPNRAEEAAKFLVDAHKESKNALSHKLILVRLYLYKLDYLVAQDVKENAKAISENVKVTEAILRDVADKDGTKEGLEARQLLRAFTIRYRNVAEKEVSQ